MVEYVVIIKKGDINKQDIDEGDKSLNPKDP